MTKPECPKCKSSDNVEEITGCRCMSCPPWICKACKPYEQAGYYGYEFWDDEVNDD